MRPFIISVLLLISHQFIFAQSDLSLARFYLGVSYGTSYAIGDFKEINTNNPNAGFAKNGTKLDLYGGKPLNEKTTITGVFRYQTFGTEIEGLIETYNAENPGANFSGSTEDWKAYYLLLGLSRQINITPKIDFFPRFGLGPMIVNNPGINISAPNSTITNNFNRSSESGFGFGIELGIGLRTDLGKHFSLMPTFTFNRGITNIPDVTTTTDNITLISDYQPVIQSFNLGLSLAYRFY